MKGQCSGRLTVFCILKNCDLCCILSIPIKELRGENQGVIFIKGYGTTAQLGILLFRNSAATSALGRPTSLGLQKTKDIRNSDQSLAWTTKTIHVTTSFAATTSSNVNNCAVRKVFLLEMIQKKSLIFSSVNCELRTQYWARCFQKQLQIQALKCRGTSEMVSGAGQVTATSIKPWKLLGHREKYWCAITKEAALWITATEKCHIIRPRHTLPHNNLRCTAFWLMETRAVSRIMTDLFATATDCSHWKVLLSPMLFRIQLKVPCFGKPWIKLICHEEQM